MRVAFFGTPEFAETVLASLLDAGEEIVLVVTQPDRRKQRRGQGPEEPSPVKRFAVEQGLPVITPRQASEATGEIESAQPDVCIVAAYGQILPESLLAIAAGRWLNVHGSLLPKYRGASPVSQAILNGETETGITIMEMVPALDSGPIIAQATVPIANDDTTGSLSKKLAEAGAQLAVKTLPRYQSGRMTPQPQNDTDATVTRTLKKSDGEIDWQKDAAYLERFVRAMQPWPGAHTAFNGRPVTVLSAHPTDGSNDGPGAFEDAAPLTVGTGSGKLIIDRLVPSGRQAMSGEAWLHGIQRAGRFGS